MKNFTDSRPFKRTNRARTLGSVLFFLALSLVFLACTPPGDEKKVVLQDWGQEIKVTPALTAGSTFGGTGTNIELTFDRELASVDSTRIVINLANKFTDSDGILKLGMLQFQTSAAQINNANKRKVELKDLVLLKRLVVVDVNDNRKDIPLIDRNRFGVAFPTSGSLPQLKKGQTLSLLLGAGALKDEDDNPNQLQIPSRFVKTIQ